MTADGFVIESAEPVLEIELLLESGEDGGDFMGWYAKGHFDEHAFADAVNIQFGLTPDSRRYCWPRHVKQTYYRTVKMEGEDSYEFRSCKGPAPGAWAVTVANLYAHDVYKREQGRMESRDHGRREALNWVLAQQGEGRVLDVKAMRQWADDRLASDRKTWGDL